MHSSSSVSASSSSLSEILDRFERLTKSSGENERALRLATRALWQECIVESKKKIKKKNENENEEGTRIRSRDEKSLLRRCFLHESRVVVDEISRRVCDLAEHDVVDKEVVTSELLAALEATTDGTKGGFSERDIRYLRLEQQHQWERHFRHRKRRKMVMMIALTCLCIER